MQLLCSITRSGAIVPSRAYPGDAGLDLASAETIRLGPRQVVMVHTGVHVAIPAGHVGILASRSSLGKQGIMLANGIGVIDAGYRGELACMLINATDEAVEIQSGQRIAQLLVVPCASTQMPVVPVDVLPPSDRGEKGFGSSGR